MCNVLRHSKPFKTIQCVNGLVPVIFSIFLNYAKRRNTEFEPPPD